MTSLLDALNGGRPPYQDYVLLGGEKTPGIAVPVKHGMPRKWQKMPGYGQSGGATLFVGDGEAKEFDILVTLWLDEHWAQWDSFAKAVLEPRPIGPLAKFLGIQHPLINRSPWNITKVGIVDVSGFEDDEYGLWTCAITVLPFTAPKPALGKPIAAIPAAAKVLPTAKDALDTAIAGQLGEMKALL